MKLREWQIGYQRKMSANPRGDVPVIIGHLFFSSFIAFAKSSFSFLPLM